MKAISALGECGPVLSKSNCLFDSDLLLQPWPPSGSMSLKRLELGKASNGRRQGSFGFTSWCAWSSAWIRIHDVRCWAVPCLGRDEVWTVHSGFLAPSVTWEAKLSRQTAAIGELISAGCVALTCSTTQTTPRAEGLSRGAYIPYLLLKLGLYLRCMWIFFFLWVCAFLLASYCDDEK